jgi:transglutaminase-like putative cysteine protease
MNKKKLMDDIEEDQEPWYKGPIRWILALFLLLLIVAWAIPYYGIPSNPEPGYFPSISEVLPVYAIASSENYSISDSDFLILRNDPPIKQTATKIASLSCEQDRICHAKAIYYFVRNNYKYVGDPFKREYVQDPKEFLQVGGGDCEDGAIALGALMNSVGIESQIVLIPDHAFLRIRIDNIPTKYKRDGWVYLDWTCKNCDFGEIPLEDARYIGPE